MDILEIVVAVIAAIFTIDAWFFDAQLQRYLWALTRLLFWLAVQNAQMYLLYRKAKKSIAYRGQDFKSYKAQLIEKIERSNTQQW